MTVLRWQWLLANGGAIDAILDAERQTETVAQDGRTLSDSARGAKPDGHVVVVSPNRPGEASERPPIEAVVTFSPGAPICILRVDGQEVAPSVWPVRERPPPPAPQRSFGSWVVVAIAAAVLIAAGIGVRTLRADASAAKTGALLGVYRSSDGRFVAHYPPDLAPRPAVMPSGVTGVLLENQEKTNTFVIASAALDSAAPRDPWAVQQMLHDEALANLPKGEARYDEAVRREETCLGRAGAVVVGQLLVGGARKARVWSCAFVHEATGYLLLSMLPEPVEPADERRAKSILDATELTRLAEIGSMPKE